MNYPQRHKKKSIPWILILTIIIVVLLIVFRPAFPENIRERVFLLGSPIWNSNQAIKANVSGFASELKSKQSLIEENQKLRGELQKIRLETLTNNILREENKVLRERFGRTENASSTILAAILKRPNTTLYDTFIIDGGESVGIKEGALVVSEQNIGIGVVSETFSKSALVTLFSAPGEMVDVLINGEIAITAEGRGSGNFLVSLPRDIDIAIGEPIVLPTLSPTFFAEVEHIDINPTDPFKSILFRLPINISEERFVFVENYVQN